MNPAKVPLSVVIISKNAASQIGACIESVAFAAEVVVVDRVPKTKRALLRT